MVHRYTTPHLSPSGTGAAPPLATIPTEGRIIPFARAVRRRAARDPRPDLPDSGAWCQLLARAWDCNRRLHSTLRALRDQGASLVPGEIGMELCSPTDLAPSDYADVRRRYLVPHRRVLCRFLRALDGGTSREAVP